MGLIPAESVGDAALVPLDPVVAEDDAFIAAPPGRLVGIPAPVEVAEVLEADVLDAGEVIPFSTMIIVGGGVLLSKKRNQRRRRLQRQGENSSRGDSDQM